MALKFFWNGIKDNGGKLQLCSFDDGALLHHPEGTITIRMRNYRGFSEGVSATFAVEDLTDIQTDYFMKQTIRVEPSHPLYPQVKAAHDAASARFLARVQKRIAKYTPTAAEMR